MSNAHNFCRGSRVNASLFSDERQFRGRIMYYFEAVSVFLIIDRVIKFPTYVCMCGHTYIKSKDQPGMVANPARGQLNRENEYFPVPVRA